MQLYVKAKSKKELNERIAANKEVYGENMSWFGNDGGTYQLNGNLPTGTVIKIYEKYSGGSPVAKAYGTWNGKKVV